MAGNCLQVYNIWAEMQFYMVVFFNFMPCNFSLRDVHQNIPSLFIANLYWSNFLSMLEASANITFYSDQGR